MLNDEAKNCTFQPNSGLDNPHLGFYLERNQDTDKDRYNKHRSIKDYVSQFGENFSKANPEVFKKGILNKAQHLFAAGKYQEALNKLVEGFNMDSISREYDPDYFVKKEKKKILIEKRKKAREEGKEVLNLNEIEMERGDEDADRPNENMENKKLVPVLKDAFALYNEIVAHEIKCRKEILKLKKAKVVID